MVVHAAVVTSSTIVVAVDVGKNEFAVSVTDAARHQLLKPKLGCPMTAPSVRELVGKITRLLPAEAMVKVGIEAAGHYHLPLLASAVWPAGWELLELNPAHVTEQRKVLGKRTIKTDVIDLEAMTELLLAGRGLPVIASESVLVELTAWSSHRTRRVEVRSGLKNQLLGQLDRSFPGLTLAVPDVLGTKVGRLVAAEFADPTRLVRLGVSGLIRFGAHREVQIRKPQADKLIAAARDALPMPDAQIARQVLAADRTPPPLLRAACLRPYSPPATAGGRICVGYRRCFCPARSGLGARPPKIKWHPLHRSRARFGAPSHAKYRLSPPARNRRYPPLNRAYRRPCRGHNGGRE